MVQIQSAKAWPADRPVLALRDVPALAAVPPLLTLALFTAISATLPISTAFSRGLISTHCSLPVSAARFFSPGLFFRPPPAFELL